MLIKKNSELDLIEGILRFGPDILENCLTSDDVLSTYLKKVNKEYLDYPTPATDIDITDWFIPREYKDFDIEEFLVLRCPEENYGRLAQELEIFKRHNFIPVLKTMKYVVDTLKNNNIVWGVGRGSSVASYALYLIGVHKIDSVKYNLSIDEFFKET
jgi:DNA polymerase III alpha subunit